MGKLTTTGNEFACTVVSGTFTATGQSGAAVSGWGTGKNGDGHDQAPIGGTPGMACPAAFFHDFNFAIWGTFSGTAQLEKSFNGGTTWLPCCKDNDGTAASYTSAINLSAFEPEYGVLYRWNCTAYTSGTINYRISQ